MKEKIKKYIFKYKYVLILAFILFIMYQIFPEMRQRTQQMDYSGYTNASLLLPPVMIIIFLGESWINREVFVKYMGEGTGFKGHLIAYIFGCLGVGPLYIAFPIVAMIARKGVTYLNCLIVVGAWAVGRVQQIIYEVPSMGFLYMVIRFVLNFVFIMLISLYIDKSSSDKDKQCLLLIPDGELKRKK